MRVAPRENQPFVMQPHDEPQREPSPAAAPAAIDLTDGLTDAAAACEKVAPSPAPAPAPAPATDATTATSRATVAEQDLRTPPSGWPGVFKTPKLQNYVAKTLGAKKVRLTSAPAQEHVNTALDAGVSLPLSAGARANALLLRERVGWDVLAGFILFENRQGAGEYVSVPHWWNSTPKGLWLDLTPRAADRTEMVLVQSDQTEVPEPMAIERRKMDELRKANGLPTFVEERRQAAKAAEKAAKSSIRQMKHEMWVKVAAMKQERRQRMDSLPVTPYLRLLKTLDRLPEELLGTQSLDVNTKNLQAAEMKALSAFCAEHGDLSELTMLCLQGNPIGDEGLAILAKECFPRMPKLDFLALQSTHIGSAGVKALARNPPKGKLRSLYMWNNQFNGDALDALGEAIVRGRLKVDVLVVHTNSGCSDDSRQRLKEDCAGVGCNAQV